MQRIAAQAASVLTLIVAATLPAGATTFTWNEHVDNWSEAVNWSPVGVPGSIDSVFIGDMFSDDHVDVNIAANAGALTISVGGVTSIDDVLDINNNASLTIHGGGILNDGTIFLSSTANNTTLSFQGTGPGGINQVIAGRGKIVMGDAANNRIRTNNVIVQHGNGFGHEITGSGQILQDSGGMINHGIIRADGTNPLIVDPNGLGFLNDNGALFANANSTLRLQSGVFTQINFAGITTLDPTALVELISATIAGGTIGGLGTVTASGSTIDGVVIQNGVTYEQNNNTQTTILNGLQLDGTIELNSTVNNTTLFFSGSQTLTGNGEVVLGDALNNRIRNDNTITTIGSGITLRGAGQILQDSGGMVNNGTILAQGATKLVVDANGMGFDQNGTLRAEGAGGIEITTTTMDLAGGNSVDVNAGSALSIISSTIQDGALHIADPVTATLSSVTLDNMVVNGKVSTANNISNTVINGLELNGAWHLDSTVNNTTLNFSGSQTLTGNGEVVLGDALNNRIRNDNTVTTIDSGITLRGAGQILQDSGGMVNNGTILAQGATKLVVDANGMGFDQNGTLRAEGAGGIEITTTTMDLAGGNSVDVDAGSALTIISSTIQDGALHIADPVTATLSSVTLDNMVVNGKVSTANNISNTVINGLELNGAWHLDSTVNNTTLNFSGSQTLTGNGEVVLGDALNNRIRNDNTVTTIDSGITLRGAGQILQDSGGMVNNGTILAQGATKLVVDANGMGFDQNGTLRAEGAGGIEITTTTMDLAGGNSVDVNAGSALTIISSTIQDGALHIADPVTATLSSVTLDNVVVNGKVSTANNISNTVINGLELNGAWHLDSTVNNTTLNFSGSQTLTGNGEVVLGDALNNRIRNDNTVTTIDSGITLRGAGQILQNSGGMVNRGTLKSEGTVGLRVDANGNGFDNEGMLHAAGIGGLTFQEGYSQTGTTSITQVDSTLSIVTGTAAIDGGVLKGSGTVIGGIAIGGSATVNPGDSPGTLTIDGDYTQTTGGTYLVEMAGLNNFDVIDVSGTANLGGTLDIALLGGYAPAVGSSFDVLFASTIVGFFDNATISVSGGLFSVTYVSLGTEEVVRLTTVTSPVPLPPSAWMLLTALGALVARRRRGIVESPPA